MNVTVRASLIALIAIVGACWAIPVLLVSIVPSDTGMIAMMTLIYLVLPVTAIALGLLAANSARTLFWIPAALGIGSALLFPLAVEGSRDLAFHGVAYTAIGYAAMGLRTVDDCSTTSLSHRSNNHAGKPRAKQFLQRSAGLAAYDVQQIR